MKTMVNDPHRRRLWANVAIFLVAAIGVNALIFGLGWDGASTAAKDTPMIPPGAVVGAVWIILFALMAVARWLYILETADRGWRAQMPVLLGLICLAYPFYTSGFGDSRTGFYGTIATLAITVGVITAMASRSRRAAVFILPTALWTGYVAVISLIYGY